MDREKILHDLKNIAWCLNKLIKACEELDEDTRKEVSICDNSNSKCKRNGNTPKV